MRKHPVDVLSLVAGLLFIAIGGLYLLGDLDAIEIESKFVGPAALMAIGAAGLAIALRDRRPSDVERVEDAPPS